VAKVPFFSKQGSNCLWARDKTTTGCYLISPHYPINYSIDPSKYQLFNARAEAVANIIEIVQISQSINCFMREYGEKYFMKIAFS